MMIEHPAEISNLLENYSSKKVGLVTHVNPDGDGLVAAIALCFCLKEIYNADPYLIMESNFPKFLDFLNFDGCPIMSLNDYISKVSTHFDLLFQLDCHELDRVDCDIKIFDMASCVVVIDHHVVSHDALNPNFIYYLDEHASCTGVMLHRILNNKLQNYAKQEWVKLYADCIYTTILNDTDNFLNSNSDKETYALIPSLIDLGLQPSVIANNFLNRKSMLYYRFVGNVLSTITVKNKVAFYFATSKMLMENSQTIEAYSKIMRWTKGAIDADMTISFLEYPDNLWRISLRSEKYDVAEIAQHFKGGGHKKAAGFQITGSQDNVITQVLAYIESITV
jgi:phosphoesterase RecJ-like protein